MDIGQKIKVGIPSCRYAFRLPHRDIKCTNCISKHKRHNVQFALPNDKISLEMKVNDYNNSNLECWNVLDDFSKRNFYGEDQDILKTEEGRAQLRKAILDAIDHEINMKFGSYKGHQKNGPLAESDCAAAIMFGVCASNGQVALFALSKYVDAVNEYCYGQRMKKLELNDADIDMRVYPPGKVEEVRNPCFLKYAPGQHFYLANHQGNDRGVILQIGDKQCSHLPLGLFGAPDRN